MAENGNLNNNNNNFDNFNINSTTQSTREFINSTATTTTRVTYINSTTTTSLPGTTSLSLTTNINELTGDQCESDATHYRLRDGVTEDFEYISCLSCGESFKSTSLIEVYDHYRERPHLRHFSNCLYCQGKVHKYYHNRLQQIRYYHNCLLWKRGDNN